MNPLKLDRTLYLQELGASHEQQICTRAHTCKCALMYKAFEAGISERTRCADGGVLTMHVAIFVTVVSIVVGFAAPTCANDRPSDPFGNYTVDLNEQLCCSFRRIAAAMQHYREA